MQNTYNLVSEGTFTVYDRVLLNFANDDISTVTFDTDLVNMKTGKGGNTIFSKNEQGRNGSAVLRLIRGSADDQFLQTKLDAQKRDFATAELAFGEFVLRIGDGEGGVASDTITLKGGMITRAVDGRENTSGDTEQGVAVYTIRFADADRAIR